MGPTVASAQGVGILSPDEASPTNHGRLIGVGTPLLPTPRRRERPYSGVGNGAVWTSVNIKKEKVATVLLGIYRHKVQVRQFLSSFSTYEIMIQYKYDTVYFKE